MNSKVKKTKKQVSEENPAINLLSKEEVNKKIEAIEKDLKHQPGESWKQKVNSLRMTSSLSSLMKCL